MILFCFHTFPLDSDVTHLVNIPHDYKSLRPLQYSTCWNFYGKAIWKIYIVVSLETRVIALGLQSVSFKNRQMMILSMRYQS